MDSLFGMEFSLPMKFFIAFAIVLILIGTAAYLLRRFGTGALAVTTQRNRQPRLAVVDNTPIDARRKLVIVRRDNVEHLLLIGGPTDVLVESNIVRAGAQALRETALRSATAEPLALPEEANWPVAAPPAPMRPEPIVTRSEAPIRPETILRNEPPPPQRPQQVYIPAIQPPPAQPLAPPMPQAAMPQAPMPQPPMLQTAPPQAPVQYAPPPPHGSACRTAAVCSCAGPCCDACRIGACCARARRIPAATAGTASAAPRGCSCACSHARAAAAGLCADRRRRDVRRTCRTGSQ